MLLTARTSISSADIGEIVILYDQLTEKPLMLPLLYSSLQVCGRAKSTQRAHVDSIKLFYLYWEYKFNINFDDYLFQSSFDFSIVCNNLSGFANWMTEKKSIDSIDPKVKNVSLYLRWIVERYFTTKYFDCSVKDIYFLSLKTAELISKKAKYISNKCGRNASNSNKFSEFNSLNHQAKIAVSTIIRPSTFRAVNTKNPWIDQHVQIRNYLMCTLMMEYGLRIGEVLNLTTFSVMPNVDKSFYKVVITENKNHPNKNKPKIKNKYALRSIDISNDFADMLLGYIESVRPLPCPAHDALFVSSRKGFNALSVNSPRWITKSIFDKLKEVFPMLISEDAVDSIRSITPHCFRHTWASNTMAYLVEEKKYSVDQAVEMLTKMGGWSIDSEMPLLYANRYLSERANSLNIERINSDANSLCVNYE